MAKRALLLVEDNLDDEFLSMRAITSSGVSCEVSVVRHGGDALRLIESADWPVADLIVLDFHLPGLNGLEILRALRSQEKTRRVPIVMLSSEGSDADILDCLSEGANSCVRKPLNADTYKEHVMLIVKYWLAVDKRPDLILHRTDNPLTNP